MELILLKKTLSLIVMITFLAITFLMLTALTNLEISVEFDSLLPDSSEAIQNMQRMDGSFGESKEMLLIVKTDDILNPKTSKQIFAAIENLKDRDGVHTVRSIFDAADMTFSGGLQTKPYFENGIPLENADEILKNRLYVGSLVNEDGSTLFIPVLIEEDVSSRNIKRDFERELTGMSVFSTGEPVIWDEMNRSIVTLVMVYPPILFGIVWFIYWLKIRHRLAAAIPVIIALVATLWTYGIASWTGFTINILTSTVGLFVVIICSAYGLHFLDRFMYNATHNGRAQAISITLKEEIAPISLSAITTVAGFMAFTFGNIEGFSELGILVSIGIALSAIFTLTVLPRFLALVTIQNGEHKSNKRFFGITVSRKLQRFSWIATIGIVCLSPLLLRNIVTNFDQLEYFRKDSSVRESASVAREEMGWVLPFYVVLEKDGVFTASDERRIRELVVEISGLGDVTGVSSIIDVSEAFGVPLPILQIASRNMELPLEDFLAGNSTRLLVKTERTDAIGVGELRDSIEVIIGDFTSLNPYIAAPALTMTEMNNEILSDQIITILAAMVAFLILLTVVFRSFLTSIVAVIPIACTVLMNFIFMGIFGVRLDIATAIVAGVLMGLTIDYSIHLVTRYRQKRDVNTVLEEIAPVIVASAIALSAGFGTLVFAPLMLFIRLGVLLAIGMLAGAFFTLGLLPVLLVQLERQNRKKSRSTY